MRQPVLVDMPPDERRLVACHEAAHSVARQQAHGVTGRITINADGSGAAYRDPPVYPDDLRTWDAVRQELVCCCIASFAEVQFFRTVLHRRDAIPQSTSDGWAGDRRQCEALLALVPVDVPTDWLAQTRRIVEHFLSRPDNWFAIVTLAEALTLRAWPLVMEAEDVTRRILEALDAYAATHLRLITKEPSS